MKQCSVDFLFIYEVKARELENVCLLACELEHRGYTVAVANSWELLVGRRTCRYSCDTLVVSACYNDEVYRFFTGLALNYKKVFCLQWEQIPSNSSYYSDKVTSWTYQGVAKQVRNICWGKANQERLTEKFDVAPDCTRITGYIPLDFYRLPLRLTMRRREELFSEYGLNPATKTCLFVSSFAYINLPARLEAVADEGFKKNMREVSERTQSIVLEWIGRLLKENPKVQFVYRPHPSEANNPTLQKLAREQKTFFYISQEAIKHWLCACDRVYIWNSTTAAEAWQSGTATFLLRPVEIPFECDMPIFEKSRPLKSYDEFAESVLRKAQGACPFDREILGRHYSITEKPAYKKICDWLEETRHDECYSSPEMPRYGKVSYQRMWYEYKVAYAFKNVVVHRVRYRLCYWPLVWMRALKPARSARNGIVGRAYAVAWRFVRWIRRCLLLKTPLRKIYNKWGKGEYLQALREEERTICAALQEERQQWERDKARIRKMQEKLAQELEREKQSETETDKRRYDREKYRLNKADQNEIKSICSQLKACLYEG